MKCIMFASVLIAGLFLWSIMGSAGQGDLRQDGDDHPSVAVTKWTERMELFMEYPLPVTGIPAQCVIHLTTLDDFEPVRFGSVKLEFTHESGTSHEVFEDNVLREGIFTPEVTLPRAGDYRLVLTYSGENVADSFEIPDFRVYEDEEKFPVHEENGGEGISFLKEQQWKIDFRTEEVRRRAIRASLRAVAKVLPQQKGYAELVSPVDGVLAVESEHSLVIPGSMVEKGQTLAHIFPTFQGKDSWTDIKLSFEKARREYERVKRLKEHNAVSQREFEDFERNYLVKKASYDSFTEFEPGMGTGSGACSEGGSDAGSDTGSAAGSDPGSDAGSGETDCYAVHALIGGSVIDMKISPGQKIGSGQELLTIVDLTTVWLQVNVSETDFYRMSEPVGLYLTIPGRDPGISITKSGIRLLSTGSAVDPASRTVPVLLEITNPDRLLLINQYVDVELYFGGAEPVLCVSRSAVFDDDANDIVFVQTGGESFEKRVVTVGDHENGWVSIPDGLREGERVVTRGGYQVKLASSTVETGHGHSH